MTAIAPDTQTEVTTSRYDVRSARQTRAVIDLYQGYLLEELDRTGQMAPGHPVALHLKTLLVWDGNSVIGLASLDIGRCAVELVYLKPAYRGRGLGRAILLALKASCPGEMLAKAPLTPLGQKLVESVGVGLSGSSEAVERQDKSDLQQLHQTINAQCRHRRQGNPSRPCLRCYRRALRRAAEVLIGGHAAACFALAEAS